MPDETVPDRVDKLIFIVPGFRHKPQRNQSLDKITRHLSAFLGCPMASPVNIAGYSGKQLSVESERTTYRFFELYWQYLGTQLSDETIQVQLTRGIGLLFSWTWKAILKPKYFRWGLYLGLGLLAMAFWFYGLSAVALNSLGGIHGVDNAIVSEAKRVAEVMLNWPVWVYASLILGALSINVGVIVDVTDLVTRYFTERIENNGLTLREQYAMMIRESVASIASEGKYTDVTVLGHSLGCAIAVDAISTLHNEWLPKCRLITLGGFLEFITLQYPAFDDRVKKCLTEQKVTAWLDFFASDDPFTSTVPLVAPSSRYTGKRTNNGAGLLDRVTGRSHEYYFTNQEVLKALV